MRKPVGWQNEPQRHSLAARGIKTTTFKARGEGDRQTCEDLVYPHFRGRVSDLFKLWNAYINATDDEDEYVEDIGSFHEYGLSFDYIAPRTFSDDQEEGYFRYQLSWGGPSDEFRFYVGPGYELYRMEYWYMDWFDGAKYIPGGEDYNLLEEIYNWFNEAGVTEAEYEKSTEY